MTAVTAEKVAWHFVADEVAVCNCDWACPCQFNDLRPTHGFCEAMGGFAIRQGTYGDVDLAGVKWVEVFNWPGPVHEGNGTRTVILDEATSPEQRAAVIAMTSGAQGHPYFEIFSSLAPTVHEPQVARISITADPDTRVAEIDVEGLGNSSIGPIIGMMDMEKRVRLDMPEGFEFKVAEVANATQWHFDGVAPLAMRHERTYAQLSVADWDSDGNTR